MRQLIWCSLSQSLRGQRQNIQGSRGCKLWDPAGSVLGDRTSFRLRLIFYIKHTQNYNANFFVSYKLGSLKPLMYPEYSLAHNGYLLLVLSSRDSSLSQMWSSLGSTSPMKKIKALTVISQAKNKGTTLLHQIWKYIKCQDPMLSYSLPANSPSNPSSVVFCMSLQEASCWGGAGLRDLKSHWVQTKDETRLRKKKKNLTCAEGICKARTAFSLNFLLAPETWSLLHLTLSKLDLEALQKFPFLPFLCLLFAVRNNICTLAFWPAPCQGLWFTLLPNFSVFFVSLPIFWTHQALPHFRVVLSGLLDQLETVLLNSDAPPPITHSCSLSCPSPTLKHTLQKIPIHTLFVYGICSLSYWHMN